jgi:hypothetical protein
MLNILSSLFKNHPPKYSEFIENFKNEMTDINPILKLKLLGMGINDMEVFTDTHYVEIYMPNKYGAFFKNMTRTEASTYAKGLIENDLKAFGLNPSVGFVTISSDTWNEADYNRVLHEIIQNTRESELEFNPYEEKLIRIFNSLGKYRK